MLDKVKDRKRIFQLDLIRSLAILFTISIHFIYYIGYYQNTINGLSQYILTLMRTIFICCVPLFLLLSGYLMKKKCIKKSYYLRLIELILTYILCGILCQIFIFLAKGGKYPIEQAFLSFFSFKAAPYGWYVEMYIGLFLIIPFLNICWENLELNNKKIIIIVLLILTTLPSLFNIFDFSVEKWWIGSANNYTKLFPDYWSLVYPVTYYYLGCFIEENKSFFLSKIKIIWIIIFILLFGTLNFIKYYNNNFLWLKDTDYNSYQSVIMSVCIFILCLKIKDLPSNIKKIIFILSNYSFEVYLISYIFDSILYKIMHILIKSYNIKIFLYIIFVPLIIMLSISLSFFIKIIVKILENKLYKWIRVVYKIE